MTSQEQRIQHQAEILARSRGHKPEAITKINTTDGGELSSIELGADENSMGRFVLNFGL